MHRNYLLFCLVGILTCLLSSTVGHEAIVGGHVAFSQATFRYQVVILVTNAEPRCGGGIIGSHLILTAAHCVVANTGELIGRSISALVGTHDLGIPGAVYESEKIFVSRDYNPQNYIHGGDIAVLKLKLALEMERYNLKELKMAKNTERSFFANKETKIAGFGWDVMFENSNMLGEHTDHKIRFADAKVRSDVQCRQEHPNVPLTEKHLCARLEESHPGQRRGVCVGDDGGPLVLAGHTVIAVLSESTLDCNEGESSAIYTSVAHYRSFLSAIKKNLEPLNARIFKL